MGSSPALSARYRAASRRTLHDARPGVPRERLERFLSALHEAQALASAGEYGTPLSDVVRHARELYDIMVEELGNARRVTGEYAGGLLLETDERLTTLEKFTAEE
jgi:hypothetical protein